MEQIQKNDTGNSVAEAEFSESRKLEPLDILLAPSPIDSMKNLLTSKPEEFKQFFKDQSHDFAQVAAELQIGIATSEERRDYEQISTTHEALLSLGSRSLFETAKEAGATDAAAYNEVVEFLLQAKEDVLSDSSTVAQEKSVIEKMYSAVERKHKAVKFIGYVALGAVVGAASMTALKSTELLNVNTASIVQTFVAGGALTAFKKLVSKIPSAAFKTAKEGLGRYRISDIEGLEEALTNVESEEDKIAIINDHLHKPNIERTESKLNSVLGKHLREDFVADSKDVVAELVEATHDQIDTHFEMDEAAESTRLNARLLVIGDIFKSLIEKTGLDSSFVTEAPSAVAQAINYAISKRKRKQKRSTLSAQ